MEQINLTSAEELELKTDLARLDGMAVGYAAGIEEAKKLAIKGLLAKRKANGTVTESGNAAAGHAPVRADQPVPQVQPAGGANQPERTGSPAAVSTDISAKQCNDGRTDGPVLAPSFSPAFPISGSTYDPELQRIFRDADADADEPLSAAG